MTIKNFKSAAFAMKIHIRKNPIHTNILLILFFKICKKITSKSAGFAMKILIRKKQTTVGFLKSESIIPKELLLLPFTFFYNSSAICLSHEQVTRITIGKGDEFGYLDA